MPIHAHCFQLGNFDQYNKSDWASLWHAIRVISRSAHARLQVSVCSSCDLFHPG